ncbi:uncharacterized protein Z518_01878 [Rhinocladiella mackenziei CBS 650.93]|uniref:AB hydrolase-1 domain-containing protein n=1 Tax=Rhinocladiella mackenziei CBS 650.93 TaxID=1442369 RepID=A0A0D2JDG6_9EURO|nr:uncharacterized protein Z518_01878 [Rhinocladiella mackenziei CBS 650.93]KIX07225.1 hypothetical protein Z518_01878 [Rhinocladiella mackenziei CBS 650.93]
MFLCRIAQRPPLRRRAIGVKSVHQSRHLSHFRVLEHIVPAQHTRHWPRGTEVGYENALKLAVKQYVPNDNSNPQADYITFIATHANGFPKEMYEPMFDDLYEKLSLLGRKIRAIWIADIVHQGQSGVLNEDALGNDPNWWDFARDLLFLINQKQNDMPQPLVGIGHSMGATQLTQLALIHPRLLQALVLIDPVIQTENPSKPFAQPSTYRRDIWPSREDAIQHFSNNKFYQAWDPRVLEQWVKYGLRDLPTALYPETGNENRPPVTLTTPKSQEVFSYLRPKYYGSSGISPEKDRSVYGDLHPEDIEDYPFYRPEPAETFRRLPELKPPVLYIFGKNSELATSELRRKKMENTGVGLGGSGGKDDNRVKEVILDCGHLVPMEMVTECAEAAASFAASEISRWEQETREWQERWLSRPRKDRVGIDDQWREMIGAKTRREESNEEKRQTVYNWEPHKDVCYKLYIEERKSLEEIMQHMRDTANFTPSKRAFQTQFKRWDFPSKRKPAFRDEDLVDRVKELWENNYSQRNMLAVLHEEGHDIKERELMRLRAKNRWLMRIPNGAKQVPTDDEEAQLEAQLLHAAQNEGTVTEPAPPTVSDNPPPEFLEKQKERLNRLQAISDERWANKKRRRRTKGYAGLPADPPGPPRFPSETTLEESRQILSLNTKQYRAIRDQFQAMCEEEQILQKTVAGAEKWQAVKDRLVRENTLLQAVLWTDTSDLQSKELALDVICTDVTKRIRTMGRRLTILESKNVLGLNPEQSRQIRSGFYDILNSEHYTSKLEMGPEMWQTLKNRWISTTPLLQQILAPGNADPDHEKKQAALELLCRDVMKRVRDDRAKKKGTFRKKTSQTPTRGADTSPPATVHSVYGPSQPVNPFSDVSTTMQNNDLSDLQIDPNLLQVADNLGPPPASVVTPVYVRPHPKSTMYNNTKMWLGSLSGRTVQELHAMLAIKYPTAKAARIDGIEKDATGNEISYLVEEDEELDAYLDHVQGRKATFVVLLKKA